MEEVNFSNRLALRVSSRFLRKHKAISLIFFLMFLIPFSAIFVAIKTPQYKHIAIPTGIFMLIVYPFLITSAIACYMKHIHKNRYEVAKLKWNSLLEGTSIFKFFFGNMLVTIGFFLAVLIGEVIFLSTVYGLATTLQGLTPTFKKMESGHIYQILGIAFIILFYFFFKVYLYIPVQALSLIQKNPIEAFKKYFTIFYPKFWKKALNPEYSLFFFAYFGIFAPIFFFSIVFLLVLTFINEILASQGFSLEPEISETLSLYSYLFLILAVIFIVYAIFYNATAFLFGLYKTEYLEDEEMAKKEDLIKKIDKEIENLFADTVVATEKEAENKKNVSIKTNEPANKNIETNKFQDEDNSNKL